ncbi:MAG: hypothetical protein HKN91_16170 [Acidimicrobiia bacterium]|nr:hypothetical protein [Acidimicrobiia bacterium]
MSSRSSSPSSIAVVAILTDGDASIDHTLEAVAAQTYTAGEVRLVGGDAKPVADALDVGWDPDLRAMIGQLEPTVMHVWLLRAGSVPRPDALHALISEADRVGAGVAGSKLLDLDNADRLISVGLATDVFDVPYLGIDEDELDAGQYDVVRDVAALEADSLLIRRDLFKGLGGPDAALAPQASAIDLSQRARAFGARVVVVPSSEVAVPPQRRAPEWREEAGRIRAMLKVYTPITLLWTIPVRFLIGLVEALLAPLAGRWTLFVWLRAWLWNLIKLPSTLAARGTARGASVAGDAELFRYQLRGSATLRRLWGELVDAARARFPSEERGGVASLAQEVRRPAFGVGLAAFVFSLIATRSLWSGFPAGAMSLPLPESGGDAIAAYAGGWNPAGFGSSQQLPPFLGFSGLWQRIWFDDPTLAAGSMVLLAFVMGIWGTARLLRTWSIDSVPGILAGLAFMAGPAARTIAGTGDVANLVAIAGLPWVARIALAPWPPSWLARIGRVLAAGWVSGLLANISPEMLLLPAGAIVLLAVLDPRRIGSWQAVATSVVGAGIGVLMLRPWINRVDFTDYIRAGEAFWEPGVVLAVAALVAVGAVLVATPGSLWRVGLWGGLIGATGFALARTASEGGGRHLEALGLGAVAMGTAIVAGVLFDSLRRVNENAALSRVIVPVGAGAAALIVLSSVLVLGPGRAGLPADDLSSALRFTGASIDDESAARVLLIGPADSLPGTSRTVMGANYRVISAPSPRLWEAELPTPGPADDALRAVLEDIVGGGGFRAGQQLAEFGIRWVVEMDSTPLSSRFERQLDLIPLDGLRRTVFLVDSPDAVRAAPSEGAPWAQQGTGFVGDPADEVLVKDQADAGWGEDADPDDWAMTLDGRSGEVGFAQDESAANAAAQSLWLGLALAVGSILVRRRR